MLELVEIEQKPVKKALKTRKRLTETKKNNEDKVAVRISVIRILGLIFSILFPVIFVSTCDQDDTSKFAASDEDFWADITTKLTPKSEPEGSAKYAEDYPDGVVIILEDDPFTQEFHELYFQQNMPGIQVIVVMTPYEAIEATIMHRARIRQIVIDGDTGMDCKVEGLVPIMQNYFGSNTKMIGGIIYMSWLHFAANDLKPKATYMGFNEEAKKYAISVGIKVSSDKMPEQIYDY